MNSPTIRRDEWLSGLQESLRNDPKAVTTRELIQEFGESRWAEMARREFPSIQ